jgi:hypothetical protein
MDSGRIAQHWRVELISRPMEYPKPSTCAHKGKHRATVKIWLSGDKVMHDRKVAGSINCDVTEENWDKHWEEFLEGNHSICLCECAAYDRFLW